MTLSKDPPSKLWISMRNHLEKRIRKGTQPSNKGDKFHTTGETNTFQNKSSRGSLTSQCLARAWWGCGEHQVLLGSKGRDGLASWLVGRDQRFVGVSIILNGPFKKKGGSPLILRTPKHTPLVVCVDWKVPFLNLNRRCEWHKPPPMLLASARPQQSICHRPSND